MFSVSDRILVLGATGTVRYVGHLSIWGNDVLAYGVEWDDAARGKNNGEIDGVGYFTPKQPMSGSFLKASNKKIEPVCLFFEAVFQRYSSEANALALETKVSFGSKIVENYGFRKLNEILNNVTALGAIMVDHQNISIAGTSENHVFGSTAIFNAESLDLSSNLLVKWGEVAQILRHFHKVKSVYLNGNRLEESLLSEIKDNLAIFPKTITHICLSASLIIPLALLQLNLENVTKIELAENKYTDSELQIWKLPANLTALDLSYNNLKHVPEICNNDILTHLILANNDISSMKESPVFAHIKILDLRRNPLPSFEEVDLLAKKFPNLCELRLNDCPVFEGLSDDEMAFNLIGRFRCEPWRGKPSRGSISKLNGSYLLVLEITNAELYFISRVRSGHLAFSNTKRWHEILAKHGISDQVPISNMRRDELKITLSIRKASKPHQELFSRVFLQKTTVLRLKGIIAKHIGTYILDFSIFYYVNDDENTAYKSLEVMDDDIATLQSHGCSQNHRIYVL